MAKEVLSLENKIDLTFKSPFVSNSLRPGFLHILQPEQQILMMI